MLEWENRQKKWINKLVTDLATISCKRDRLAALTTLSFRDNFSVESIFSQALLIIVSLLSRKSFAIVMAMERISVQRAKNTKQLNLFLQSACQYYDSEEGLARRRNMVV
jgi:hypothetical protein